MPSVRECLVHRLVIAIAALGCLVLPACQQKMAKQPSIRPDEPSTLLPKGRASRPPVTGAVARGHLRTDLALFTGKRTRPTPGGGVAAAVLGAGPDLLNVLALAALARSDYLEDANNVDAFPFEVNSAVLEQGRERYMIYCVVCHDARGTGHGKIVERGYTPPPSYHIERLRNVHVGHFYDVITNGYGSMPDYKQQVPPRDRWAIAAYIRALQLSQHFPEGDLTAEMREERDKAQTTAGGKAP
jgi:mono/diheme cytochrome c family protein